LSPKKEAGRKKVKKVIVHLPNKLELISYLESILEDRYMFLDYKLDEDYYYDEYEDVEERVIVKHEILKAIGRVNGVLVSVSCSPKRCRVEALEYGKTISKCTTDPELEKLMDCIAKSTDQVRRYREEVEIIHSMGDQLGDWYWLDKHPHGLRANKIETLDTGMVRVEVELKPWKGSITLSAEGTPEDMVRLAKHISEAVMLFTRQINTSNGGEVGDGIEKEEQGVH
jgi:hypothetical protein